MSTATNHSLPSLLANIRSTYCGWWQAQTQGRGQAALQVGGSRGILAVLQVQQPCFSNSPMLQQVARQANHPGTQQPRKSRSMPIQSPKQTRTLSTKAKYTLLKSHPVAQPQNVHPCPTTTCCLAIKPTHSNARWLSSNRVAATSPFL